MKSFVENYGKTILFFAIIALIGGFFTGLFMIDTFPQAFKQEFLASISQEDLPPIPINLFIAIVSSIQSTIYAVVLGTLGIVLGTKVGLYKNERSFATKPLLITLTIAFLGGISLILSDVLYFSQHSAVIAESYTLKPNITFVLASVTYGAVVEEIMVRLFLMSLIALLLHKFFGKNTEKPTTTILVIANIISALLFAAGHLPATLQTIGSSPIILFRCFALNGASGILFGYLYQKYGLRYSMIAHGGCHLVSKAIWLVFL
ncbi:MAG: CPBP family intramembrane metalloprotease [Paludibacteraceae bacterium]|nr:CPBP family intramembrane metalloprotease [Paludibacteraceae bacterium]